MLKKTTLFITAFVAAALFCGCSSKKVNFGNPESVARAYLMAVQRLDFEESKKYCTKATAEMMELFNSLMASLSAEERKNIQDQSAPEKLKKITCVALSSTSTKCTYCCLEEEESDEEPFVLLVKEGNKWLVDLPKEEEGEEGTEN